MHAVTRSLLAVAALAALAGCSPVSTAVKLGVHVVGKVVDDAETNKLARQLAGQPPAAADQALGNRLDTLRDVNSDERWLVYPVKLDVLGQSRYVVGVSRGRIVDVQLAKRNSSTLDIPLKLVYEKKVKGKSPAECDAALGMGAPVLVVRSEVSGDMGRLYDPGGIPELSGQKYCVLRFDDAKTCKSLEFVEIAASATQ